MIFEIFDFFGGFSWEAHSFQRRLLCGNGSLLDAWCLCGLKRPCGRPFWQYRPAKFLYRTAVRTGPSLRKKTEDKGTGVFRCALDFNHFFVEGKGGDLICWYLRYLLIIICMPGTQRFLPRHFHVLLICFKPPAVMIKHWDMLFCPIMKGLR